MLRLGRTFAKWLMTEAIFFDIALNLFLEAIKTLIAKKINGIFWREIWMQTMIENIFICNNIHASHINILNAIK